MSTLPPRPVFDPNVPVVTPEGGTAIAYQDPLSPESLLRKTATLEAQAKVDSMYNVAVSPYVEKKEGFRGFREGSVSPGAVLLFVLALLFLSVSSKKAAAASASKLLLIVAVGFLAIAGFYWFRR